jgi:predicted alpha/beta superfamily hydrolase
MGQWEDHAPPDRKSGRFAGSVKLLRGVHSPQLGNTRDIVVYLPPSYERDERRYPVVYMQDGQNLFDDRTAFAGAWKVDHAVEDASRAGVEAIIVAIPNMGHDRLNEYSPWPDSRHGGGRGDAYVEFVASTLKPRIDADLRTLSERESTGIAGSSMGGLISLYAFLRAPTTFGLCGAMSPALWFADARIHDYLADAPFLPGRIYLDCGTREGEREIADVRRVCDALRSKGYRSAVELLCVIEAGAAHHEPAWAARTRRMLDFLLRRGGSNGELDVSPASADSVRR